MTDAELIALREDAERYRWLRDGFVQINENYLHTEEELMIGHIPIWRHRLKIEQRWESIDAAIDAARGVKP